MAVSLARPRADLGDELRVVVHRHAVDVHDAVAEREAGQDCGLARRQLGHDDRLRRVPEGEPEPAQQDAGLGQCPPLAFGHADRDRARRAVLIADLERNGALLDHVLEDGEHRRLARRRRLAADADDLVERLQVGVRGMRVRHDFADHRLQSRARPA